MRFLSLFVLLAACGGSSDGPGAAARLSAFDDAFAAITAMDVTPIDQLPAGGIVSYGGDMRLAFPLGPEGSIRSYLGHLQVAVSFDPAMPDVSGDIGDFVGPDGGLSGGIAISDGTIDFDADPATDYLFAGTLAGQLSDGTTDYDIRGEIAGDFHGRDADAIAGVVFGTVTEGAELDIFDGTFAAVSP